LEDTKAAKEEKEKGQMEAQDEAKDEAKDKAKVLYTTTLQQEEQLEEISKFCKDTCTKLDVHTEVNFDDPLQCVDVLAALTVDLAGVLKFSVIEAKSMGDDIEMHQVYVNVYVCVRVCVCRLLCLSTCLPVSIADAPFSLMRVLFLAVSCVSSFSLSPYQQISDAHVQLYEHAHKLSSIEGGTDTYTLMLEVTRQEQQLKNIMSEQVARAYKKTHTRARRQTNTHIRP